MADYRLRPSRCASPGPGNASAGYRSPMSDYDTKMLREFLRGAAQVHVLYHAAEGDVHGAWLAVELRRHGYDISPGTLYPMLHRMERSGLLVSRAEVVEGRTRRLYSATEAGTSELALLRAAVAELAGEVLDDNGRLKRRRREFSRTGAGPA